MHDFVRELVIDLDQDLLGSAHLLLGLLICGPAKLNPSGQKAL